MVYLNHCVKNVAMAFMIFVLSFGLSASAFAQEENKSESEWSETAKKIQVNNNEQQKLKEV